MSIPEQVRATRARVAHSFISGHGIEIGALDEPTPLPPGTVVRYVDFRTKGELALQYPEIDPAAIAEVHVIDDGEHLRTFDRATVDFLIANQMLEHCQNPLGTLRRHLEVLKPAGWLFYAVPDRRVTFDSARPLTTFDHLVADDRDDGAGSRLDHYLEWARFINGKTTAEEARADAERAISRGYSIHFHVWDASAWLEFLTHARTYLGNVFEVRYFEFTGTEILCVLRREG